MLREVARQEAWQRKYPEGVWIAVTMTPRGTPNAIALGWVMPVSGKPPLCAIAVGKTRYSHECLKAVPEFVLAIPSEDQHAEMLYCGSHSGRDEEKFPACGFKTAPATKVRPPLLLGCCANLECKVVAAYDGGDHTIFMGEILASHADPDAPGRLYTLGKNRYGGVREIVKTGPA